MHDLRIYVKKDECATMLPAPVFELVEDKKGGHKLVLVRDIHEDRLTFGQRSADKISMFGGSWTFIFMFGIVLVAWVTINSTLVTLHPYDPYPFILLNLFLSMLAAIQAPVIMMSNNRQAAKDRDKLELGFRIGLKAELEVELLHKKLDKLKQTLSAVHIDVEDDDKEIDIDMLHKKLDEVLESLEEVIKR